MFSRCSRSVISLETFNVSKHLHRPERDCASHPALRGDARSSALAELGGSELGGAGVYAVARCGAPWCHSDTTAGVNVSPLPVIFTQSKAPRIVNSA